MTIVKNYKKSWCFKIQDVYVERNENGGSDCYMLVKFWRPDDGNSGFVRTVYLTPAEEDNCDDRYALCEKICKEIE